MNKPAALPVEKLTASPEAIENASRELDRIARRFLEEDLARHRAQARRPRQRPRARNVNALEGERD
jgi:hypothetical protein